MQYSPTEFATFCPDCTAMRAEFRAELRSANFVHGPEPIEFWRPLTCETHKSSYNPRRWGGHILGLEIGCRG